MFSWSGFNNEKVFITIKPSFLNHEIAFLKLEILWLALYYDDWTFLLLPKKKERKKNSVGFSAFQPRERLFSLSLSWLNASHCSVMKSDDEICQFALLNFFPQLCFNWAFGA